jgi:hypothetical protein
MHPRAERVTVLQGSFNIAMHDTVEKAQQPGNFKTMPAGSFGYWPARMPHVAWTKGETIAQFHGYGPWVIEYLNPADDPRKQQSKGAGIEAASVAVRIIHDQTVDAACGVCIYRMPGITGCPLAIKVGGTPYLVEGAEWPNHAYCDRNCKALVSGVIEGNKFIATKFEAQP